MIAATDLDRVDAAWLAGLLDGEGCFDSPRGLPRIRVGMTDHDVVLRAADLMTASTHLELRAPRKPMLRAQVTGDRAVGIMRAVLPWLGSRRSAKVTEIVMGHEARRKAPVRRLAVVEDLAA